MTDKGCLQCTSYTNLVMSFHLNFCFLIDKNVIGVDMKILLLILLMISSQSRASDLVQIHAYCSDIGSMAMNVMALRQQNIALPEAERVIRTQFQYDLENSEVSQYLSEALETAYGTPIERKVGQKFLQAEWHRLAFMDKCLVTIMNREVVIEK